MKTIVIQRAEPMPGFEYDKMLELTRAHHAAYCYQHGYEYDCKIEKSERHDIMNGGWEKIKLILEAMQSGYENIIWLDADTLITDVNIPLIDAIQPNKIGACWQRIPQLNHWNVGALYIHNSPETQLFCNEWYASPNAHDGWNEQGAFNRLALKNKTVTTISDRWNSTIYVGVVPDTVVLGFHGLGDRYKTMQQSFDYLFPKQEAIVISSEVLNG